MPSMPRELHEIVSEMRMLVALNEPNHGGPYQGTAAQRFVEVMHEAADRLDAIDKADRDDYLDGFRRALNNEDD